MSEMHIQKPETTTVDDVRHVREKIAVGHAGDLRQHIEETNRITERLRASLNVQLVPTPPSRPVRAAT